MRVCRPEVNITPQELSILFLQTMLLTELEFSELFRLAGQGVLGIHLSPLLSSKITIKGVSI